MINGILAIGPLFSFREIEAHGLLIGDVDGEGSRESGGGRGGECRRCRVGAGG